MAEKHLHHLSILATLLMEELIGIVIPNRRRTIKQVLEDELRIEKQVIMVGLEIQE